MRKTKIVCTIGPASKEEAIISKMLDAGMNVARINFSHGNHQEHGQTISRVKKLREEKNMPVAIMLDTKGPEVRTGTFKNGPVELKTGNKFCLYCTDDYEGDANGVTVSFPHLWHDVSKEDTILIDDGLVEMSVVSICEGVIECEVKNDGVVSNYKGINIPGVQLSMEYLSERDKSDLLFGISQDIDFVAASFARSAEDIILMREFLYTNGGKDIKIIAKIENAQGVEKIDDILHVSDGIMVARGDMGVEIPLSKLPSIQKKLIERAYMQGKVVITATQMLESMVKNPRPTRAEATDVANAVYDGTSAVMLSGETAAGLYPVKAVETMARIAVETESDINYQKRFIMKSAKADSGNVTNAISHATCTTAYDLGAAAIIAVTMSGTTARNISKYRPETPIIGCTSAKKAYRQLAMSWGVVPCLMKLEEDLDILFDSAVKSAQDTGVVNNGDLVVITTGVPLGIDGTTNLLKVHIVGDALVTGNGVSGESTRGNLLVAQNEEEAINNFKTGDILVINSTNNNLLPIMRKASGIVCEMDGLQSHAAIVGMALQIPVIVGAGNATKVLKSGTNVLVDAQKGVVFSTQKSKKK